LEQISEPKLMPLFNTPGGKAADFHRGAPHFLRLAQRQPALGLQACEVMA
jgi:hypothetical protein